MRTILTDSYVRKMCLKQMKKHSNSEMVFPNGKFAYSIQPENPLLIEARNPVINFMDLNGNFKGYSLFSSGGNTRRDNVLEFAELSSSPLASPLARELFPDVEQSVALTPQLTRPTPIQASLNEMPRARRPTNRLIENI